jgi:hypothetical protein
VPRLSFASRSHDPYWDLDGKGARRSRHQRRFVRWVVLLIVILTLAVLLTRLHAIDPTVLASPAAKPILAGAILSLLGASALAALARVRSVGRH